ncbi:Up in starvation [Sporothrix epigloea]|uniref:Up in starvation n=1 Tax=Sporothrix epigloea TaxID=1892477 RepID=A0ABP0DC54_9PEZI
MDSAMSDSSGPAPANGTLAKQMPLPEAASATNKSNESSENDGSGDATSNPTSAQMQQSHSQGSKSTAATSHSDEAGDVKMSDNESNADETTSKSGRKKKSQRFYCTEFPSCNLSFTRSEHLARHIRKHTGERPFECHCQRRFSRLDNLRQHAQTVHMHEDIPIGSLAATGTRFQRQIRPDRVVRVGPPAGRVRTGSLSGPSRGHSKSFSTSNIALGPGSYGIHDNVREMRPRPPPLMTDSRARLQQPEPGAYHATDETFQPITPPEMITPTSTAFSNGPATPHWGGACGSSPFGSRPHSMYATTETPSRRLSVPSSEAYYQSPSGALPTRGHMHSASASSNGGGFLPSPTQTSGHLGSPGTSTVSGWSRRESFSSSIEDRRRTWHPSSQDIRNPAAALNGMHGGSDRPMSAVAGSLNAHYQPPGPQPPPPLTVAMRPDQQNSGVRLPGIDSFLQRRAQSPMAADSERYPVGLPQPVLRSPIQSVSHQRPLSGHWDGLQHGLHRLDIAGQTPPQEPSREWNHVPYTNGGNAPQPMRFNPEVAREDPFLANSTAGGGAYSRGHQHTMSAPAYNMSMSRQTKRQAWYDGPNGAAAGGNTTRVERMVHPNLANGFSGFPVRGVPQTVHEHQPQDQDSYYQEHERTFDSYRRGPSPPQLGRRGPPIGSVAQTGVPATGGDSFRRLDALVAVATSESKNSTPAF